MTAGTIAQIVAALVAVLLGVIGSQRKDLLQRYVFELAALVIAFVLASIRLWALIKR
jgi:hypothetical protein